MRLIFEKKNDENGFIKNDRLRFVPWYASKCLVCKWTYIVKYIIFFEIMEIEDFIQVHKIRFKMSLFLKV